MLRVSRSGTRVRASSSDGSKRRFRPIRGVGSSAASCRAAAASGAGGFSTMLGRPAAATARASLT